MGQDRKFWGKGENLSWVVMLAAFVWIVSLLVCFTYIRPSSTDMVVRYAPMAESFAVGDWRLSFHPRFGVQFPVVCGLVVWLTGLPGWRACQLVALTWWAFSAVPLWMIARQIYGRVAAWFAFVIYVLNADLFRLAVEGWRDDCRILPILLATFSFLRLFSKADEHRFPLDALLASVAVLLMVTLRVDCVLIGSFFFVVFATWCLVRGRIAAAIVSGSGWTVGMVLQCWMVHAYTGWWLPVPQLIPVAERMLGGGI